MSTPPLRIYDLVRVKDDLPVWKNHFRRGEAIISGRGFGGFELFFRGHGTSATYVSGDLELIKLHQPELLDQWEEEYLEWHLAND